MSVMAQPILEQFPPQLLYHLLTAVRRFEPALYDHLSRQLHVDVERILGLFGKVELASSTQVLELLADLRDHTSYADIVFLAGRNAFLLAAKDSGNDSPGGGSSRFASLTKQLLPPFLGNAKLHFMSKGALHFVEISGSVFARNCHAIRPLCGFYSGFLTECSRLCSEDRCSVVEVRCAATDDNEQSCLFQVAM